MAIARVLFAQFLLFLSEPYYLQLEFCASDFFSYRTTRISLPIFPLYLNRPIYLGFRLWPQTTTAGQRRCWSNSNSCNQGGASRKTPFTDLSQVDADAHLALVPDRKK